MKKKLLYIGHAYHNKTKSTQFLKDMLEAKYEVEIFDFDPYNDNIQTHFRSLAGKSFDVLVIFQIMPSLAQLKKVIKFKKSVFFPMYDGVPERDNPIWLEYKNTQIINFSKTLYDELKQLGFSSHYIQYFPKPIKIKNLGNEKSVFFWQRITPINIHTVEQLLNGDKIKHIHIHKALDPKHEFVKPTANMPWKITYSEWFDTKEEMLKTQQQSAIYIAPRLYEGIGMSFLEAMAMGRCVIAPDHPTMNEYIKNGETGYLYDYNNPKPIDLNDIKKIQQNTIKFIEEGYARWEKEKGKILEWIEEKVSPKENIIKAHFSSSMDIISYKLFSFFPVITIKKNLSCAGVYLFNFILILKIKFDNSKNKSSFFEKILGLASQKVIKRKAILLVDNIFEKNANIQDTFTLFEYLYNQKKWKLIPYYMLHEKSPYKKELVEKYGHHIILWDKKSASSWKFKLKFLFLMLRLRYVCDSFQAITALPFNFYNIVKSNSHITSIFMQHGITFFKPDFITPNVYGKNIFDKVLVSNELEKELFIERGNFSNSDIIQNGLMRWDRVRDLSGQENLKSIFVFFTTRRYLSKLSNVKDSQYVNEIRNLLSNIKNKFNNIEIKIALHHSISDFLSPILKDMNISVVNEDDIYFVKQQASLLITDYSSMCFEFFLQEKPVIFYSLHDETDCCKYGHVLDVVKPYEGKEKILPNIIGDQEQLLKLLHYYISNNFELSFSEKNMQDLFFYYKSGFCNRMESYLIKCLEEKE